MSARGRFRLASPATANALSMVGAVLLLAAVPLGLMTHSLTVSDYVPTAVIFLSYGGVGFVVARRQPRNVVGWILLGFAVMLAASTGAGAYAALIYHLGHGALPLGPVAVLLNLLWAPAIVLIPLAILLFPDGQLPSPRWRWVVVGYLAAGACWPASIYTVAISTIAAHRIQVSAGGSLVAVDQPSGGTAWLTPAQGLILPVLVVFWLMFVGRQVASYRRSSDERRQQLKWLMSGAAACSLAGAVVTLMGSLDTHPSASAQAATSFASAATIALPLSIGVAILKYRLYEIDRIISRTLAYAIVTGLLVGMYAGLVLLATEALTVRAPVAVAAATLAAAALFSPLRRRVQRIVDRRFNRARYDADQAVAAFAARLQDAVDVDAVHADLLRAVYQALEPAHASVWIGGR